MTIGELIRNKDYDYVEYRMRIPEIGDIFAGCFKSENGEIISLDGDSYSKSEYVVHWETWSRPERSITNGLTVLVEGEIL